jgi:anti-anti-sigma regulatory factor
VVGPDGQVAYIIHQVEDVTEFVHLRQAGSDQTGVTGELRDQVEGMEREVVLRSREAAETSRMLKEANAELKMAQKTIRELSTPVLSLMPGLLLLPVIGVMDADRAQQLTDHLLRAIRESRGRAVVIDLTGVALVDSRVADHLVKMIDACRLMGARAVLSGLSTENALALTALGGNFAALEVSGDLQSGIQRAEDLL